MLYSRSLLVLQVAALCASLYSGKVTAFTNSAAISSTGSRQSLSRRSWVGALASSTESSPPTPSTPPPVSPEEPAASTTEYIVVDADKATDEWELDCYSRPVVVNGKKLWEVLITDSAGSFRFKKELPSNQVNSKNLRQVVDDLMEESEVKPQIIRFFRGSMFNMINIALNELAVTAKPSRCTFALAGWLEERHANVYPQMENYNAAMVGSSSPSFLDVRTSIKMPDALRGEYYAFVGLPVAEFMPGGDITPDNVGVGRLCPLPPNIPADSFVQGVVILTSRAEALAAWLAGTEVVALQCDLRKRVLTMETDIDTQYLMAKLDDKQRAEGVIFEEGKDNMQGLHFVSVQEDEDSDPTGFWLLRDLPTGV